MAAEMSQYELDRLKRIKQNNAILLALGIDDAASQLKSAAEQKPQKPRGPKVWGLLPQRAPSERSAAVEANKRTKLQVIEEGATDELGYERLSRGKPSSQPLVNGPSYNSVFNPPGRPSAQPHEVQLQSDRPISQPFPGRPSYVSVLNSRDRQIITEELLVQGQRGPGTLFGGGTDMW
jgi:hypothetical protein